MERPDIKRRMGMTLSQQVDYNSTSMRLLKELQQLGVKETVSAQNEKKLWDPNFLWAGSRLKNYSARNKRHLLQKRKEVL